MVASMSHAAGMANAVIVRRKTGAEGARVPLFAASMFRVLELEDGGDVRSCFMRYGMKHNDSPKNMQIVWITGC